MILKTKAFLSPILLTVISISEPTGPLIKSTASLNDFPWTWILLIALGVYLDLENWDVYATLVLAYWSAVAVMIYLPMLVRRLRGKPTGYVK